MKASEIREKYLKFFESKGHVIIPSDSLMPQNDPTTLFTGSGMQPMVPYLLGEKHPLGTRITDSQKCFRAQDIEEVGDNRHTTLFEMLGNWSLGDYSKKDQISWIFEFLIKEIGLDPKNLYITVFRGNDEIGISRDTEAVDFWKKEFSEAGIEAKDVDFSEEKGMQGGKIFYYDEGKNWWSRAGVTGNMPVGEPGGPDSEMFWDFGEDLGLHEKSEFKDEPCHVNCDCGRFLEIGNNVFMQYIKTEKGFEALPKGNIDFGGGLERITAAKNGDPDMFKIDSLYAIIEKIEWLSKKKYGDSDDVKKSMRVIADHIKAATFIMGDDKGIAPSNKDQGYVVRRLIRRAIRHGKTLEIEKETWANHLAQIVIDEYKEAYPELEKNSEFILDELKKEEIKFGRTLEKGLRILNKLYPIGSKVLESDEYHPVVGKDVDPEKVFDLYQTYGFPFEMIQEELGKRNLRAYEEEFKRRLKKHQELSKTASAGKFKGGLADSGEETKKLHTVAHLMLAALRVVLGTHVEQRGSNITAERLRFDFSHDEKMTDGQKQEVEELVNEIIKKKFPVMVEEMPIDEAKAKGAVGVFDSKYGEKVKVYTVGDEKETFSCEICGGPHIKNTSELGIFKIKKEQSSGAGVRRIKAILT
ncbi:alanine--tRNA ligase [Patescibacteria group bacterium]